jgi:cytochrome P450
MKGNSMGHSVANVERSLIEEARLDDAAFYLGDPYPTYARLRREAPVFWCESGGFWVLSKHEDIVWVESQPNPPFSAQMGLNMTEASKPSRVTELRQQEFEGTSELAAMSDPPNHRRFRAAVSASFAADRMKTLEARIRSIATECINALPIGEAVDFVEAVAVPVSARVIGELLGVPRERWDDLRRWTDAYMADSVGTFADDSPESQQALHDQMEMYEYVVASLEQRRKNPCEDFMSTLATGFDDEPLSQESQIAVCLALVIAGTETTRNTLSGAMVSFAQHRDQWDLLRAHPEYLGNATEELLRWVPPVLHFGRRATEPVTIRGTRIEKGDFVVMLYAAANRDEDVWPDAEVFDVTRATAQRQLAFGWGIHRCIGAAVARAEIRAVLGGLRERFGGWTLAGDPQRHPSTQVNDFHKVPIVFEGT